jgi:ABC-2 type transport system ATP-binding protein
MDDIIRLTDLEVRYGRVRALDGLSLAVPPGEVYGFLGRNGAGKTTTLRVLMGIVKPHSGKIELFGKRKRRVSVRMKRLIGYVSQEQHFYPWMTARRLGAFASSFYPTWDHQEFARLLAALDVPPDRRSVELSGGTRSKLALALALAPRPPLLLLDEPTTGLDPVARREFNELVAIMAAQHGTTVTGIGSDEVELVGFGQRSGVWRDQARGDDGAGLEHRQGLEQEGQHERLSHGVWDATTSYVACSIVA